MRVGVVHNSLNSAGGGERVCLRTIEALKEAGHEVVLATVEPTDWGRVEGIMGRTARPDEEVSLLGFRVRMFGIYLRLLTSLLALGLRKRCDLIVNTHGDILPVRADLVYVHYPTFTLLREASVNVKYAKSLFWRAYFAPYEEVQGFLARRFLGGVLLTNSSFSRRAIRRHTGRDAVVVPPPVDIERFEAAGGARDREDLVVSCGRYSPEKNYEFVLDVAEELKGRARFAVVGASSGKVSGAYYRKISGMREERGIENVELIREAPLADLLRLYARAKVFLHAMRREHFGIAVVEAMAAGLVPVVHRSGGPWEDILGGRQGIHGFSYVDRDEAVEIMEILMEDDDCRRDIAERNSEYVKIFSSEAYKKNILRILTSKVDRGLRQ